MAILPKQPTHEQAVSFLRDVASKRKRTTGEPIERAAAALNVKSEAVRVALTRGRMKGGYMSGQRRTGPGGTYEPRLSTDLSGAGDAQRILRAAGIPLNEPKVKETSPDKELREALQVLLDTTLAFAQKVQSGNATDYRYQAANVHQWQGVVMARAALSKEA